MSDIVPKILEIFKVTYNRDKIGKILQYGYKSIAWYQKEVVKDEKEAKHLESISSQLSIGRKLFRLGRFMHEYDALYKIFSSDLSKLPIKEWINVLKLFFSGNYWLFDNIYWAIKIGIYRKGDVEFYKKLSIFAWFMGAVFGFVQVVLKVLKNRADIENAIKSDDRQGLVKAKNERVDVTANLIKSVCDLYVALSYNIDTKLFPSLYTPNNGLIGLAGVVSGFADFFVIWKTLKVK